MIGLPFSSTITLVVGVAAASGVVEGSAAVVAKPGPAPPAAEAMTSHCSRAPVSACVITYVEDVAPEIGAPLRNQR
jgi:hypothetical protein